MTDPEILTEIPPELKHLFPATTTVTSKLDEGKSEGLMFWTGGLTFDYLIDTALKPVQNAIERDERDAAIELLKEFFNYDLEYHYKKAKSYHTKKSQEAKDIGSYVHEAAESIFRALLENSPMDIPVDEDIEKPVQALLTWIAENDVVPVLVEGKVFATLPGFEWGWRGRLDLVAYVGSVLTTIDLKAAKGIYADAPLQVAAYDYAYDDMVEKGILDLPGPTEQSAILRLDKETGMPDFHVYSKAQTLDNFRRFGFLCCYCHATRIGKENEKNRKKLAKEPVEPEPPY
jgi:hypothetical protein